MRVTPPGPRARRLVEALGQVEAPSIHGGVGHNSLPPLAEAYGANVLDVDGNRYVDWVAGFGVAFSGHRPPEVVKAIQRQTGRLLHGLGDAAAHGLRLRLARELAAIAPVRQARVYWAISGSDAVDLALKTAFLDTHKEQVLVFDPAYHGLGLGALGGASRPSFRRPFLGVLAKDRFVRLPYGAPKQDIDEAFQRNQIGAVLFEPLVGREGVRQPPQGWLKELGWLARQHGALLVADEVLTGGGRTGEWFAVQHEGLRPDLLCCGKVISGGAPLAAVIGRKPLFARFAEYAEAAHTSTFLAYPPACAGALANLQRIRRLNLLKRAVRIGCQLREWSSSISGVTLSGQGALQGLHLPTAELASRFAVQARQAGFLVLASHKVVQLTPPATMSTAQMAASLTSFSTILGELGVS